MANSSQQSSIHPSVAVNIEKRTVCEKKNCHCKITDSHNQTTSTNNIDRYSTGTTFTLQKESIAPQVVSALAFRAEKRAGFRGIRWRRRAGGCSGRWESQGRGRCGGCDRGSRRAGGCFCRRELESRGRDGGGGRRVGCAGFGRGSWRRGCFRRRELERRGRDGGGGRRVGCAGFGRGGGRRVGCAGFGRGSWRCAFVLSKGQSDQARRPEEELLCRFHLCFVLLSCCRSSWEARISSMTSKKQESETKTVRRRNK